MNMTPIPKPIEDILSQRHVEGRDRMVRTAGSRFTKPARQTEEAV